jgi:hypothetical protein
MKATKKIKPDHIDEDGFPHYWVAIDDDSRTVTIKAAKSMISLIDKWRERGVDAEGNTCGPKEMRSYYKAIELLKQEGEVYP